MAIWTIGLPAIFDLGFKLGVPGTVGIRYDARALFSLAIGLSWILVIWSVTLVALTMTRVFGLVSNGKSRFRNRIFAISAGILILSLPVEYDGLRLLISISVVIVADYFSRLVQIPISHGAHSSLNDASP